MTTALPAVVSLGQEGAKYVESTVLPAAASGAAIVNEYIQYTAAPAVSAAFESGYNHATPLQAKAAYESILETLASAAQNAQKAQLPAIPSPKKYEPGLWEPVSQLWAHFNAVGGTGDNPNFMKFIIGIFSQAADFVAKNPRVLIPLLFPVLDAGLLFIGFGPEGIIAASAAARIHSLIGNVPRETLFAFLQSYGARRWKNQLIIKAGGVGLTVAVLLAVLGRLLIDRKVAPDVISPISEKAYNPWMEKQWNEYKI
ncbi:hypothetical protein EX30DRAFT_372122 [Ascodesmis nigricans]|uniref:Uncharacterized protein n=1 Tax=Ascodesmis nigricans TaxID=341454 RepID=A0A4S2MV52_9PEZI|nr:hypothetical protein EX30DRAFT_372122 [Ascodesmis nigricans]